MIQVDYLGGTGGLGDTGGLGGTGGLFRWIRWII